MKKVMLTSALVALVALSGLWAVETKTANVDLTLNLVGSTDAGWFPAGDAPTLENWDSTKLVEDSDQAFENNALDTIELWAAVKSNENVRFNLEVKGEAMSSQKVSTTIGIHAVGEEGASVEWDGTAPDADSLTMQEALAGTQNRVFAGKITFSMDPEDFAAASAADDYSADITLTATTIE